MNVRTEGAIWELLPMMTSEIGDYEMQCEVQQAIDVHAHYGVCENQDENESSKLIDRLMSADAARVAEIVAALGRDLAWSMFLVSRR